jgi:hypothetical protein
VTDWFKARLGRFRVSTLVLIIAFAALFWVDQSFKPEPKAPTPAPAVVPPGFVPDPNYTWVPRTNVRRPKEPEYTTTTTTPTTTSSTETTGPSTTSPTSPTTPAIPTTTVVDPDGLGPLPPTTQTIVTPTPVSPAPVLPVPSPTPAPVG